MTQEHVPVLLQEALDGLNIKPDGFYIDATFGRGGHSVALLKRLGPEGRLVAIDKDPEAIAVAQKGPGRDPRFTIVQDSFANLEMIIEGIDGMETVDGILMDLGVSSPQLDDPERGFSFTREGPLDMRMNPEQGMDAATWINSAKAEDIAHVLKEYGEERFARRIANAIVKMREEKKIETTKQLAHIIADAHPAWDHKKHPATKSFQAIRIFINQELDDLKKCLHATPKVLKIGGRLSVISFHSLEDRIVKQFIQRESQGEEVPRGLPIKASQLQCRLKKVGGMIRPSDAEIKANPRARSSRLRIAERVL